MKLTSCTSGFFLEPSLLHPAVEISQNETLKIAYDECIYEFETYGVIGHFISVPPQECTWVGKLPCVFGYIPLNDFNHCSFTSLKLSPTTKEIIINRQYDEISDTNWEIYTHKSPIDDYSIDILSFILLILNNEENDKNIISFLASICPGQFVLCRTLLKRWERSFDENYICVSKREVLKAIREHKHLVERINHSIDTFTSYI